MGVWLNQGEDFKADSFHRSFMTSIIYWALCDTFSRFFYLLLLESGLMDLMQSPENVAFNMTIHLMMLYKSLHLKFFVFIGKLERFFVNPVNDGSFLQV